MEYRDLSPYEYLPHPLPMMNVGWLGRRNGIPATGEPDPNLEEALHSASRRVVGLTLGWHECEFCEGETPYQGNGEYRYFAPSGGVYVAPVMILHYIQDHSYLPPRSFLRDLGGSESLVWDDRAEFLSTIVADEDADPELRGQAVSDLANWRDRRALDAALIAARDEEFADIAGDKIGFVIGNFVRSGSVLGLRVEDFSEFVQIGMSEAFMQAGEAG